MVGWLVGSQGLPATSSSWRAYTDNIYEAKLDPRTGHRLGRVMEEMFTESKNKYSS